MRQWWSWLVTSCVFVMLASLMWVHLRDVAAPAPFPEKIESESAPGTSGADSANYSSANYEEAREAGQMVTITGPMARYVMTQQAAEDAAWEARHSHSSLPVAPSGLRGEAVNPDSPVGTTSTVVQQSFAVARAVNVPFELPPHAANPQLRGTFHASTARGSADAAKVEFLVLDERQYEELLSGRASRALFAAEPACDQEVNFSLPPTLDEPVRYHLVFRNPVRSPQKTVRADFHVDF
jgi:hypothetical protein